jgi:glycosyltransferase involved in cell wall biosynthesis
MCYSACIDAVLFFCKEILPLVRERVGKVEMWVVGRDPVPEIRALDGDGIHVTGQVEGIQPYYQRCTAVVVPLRAGGGTRLKILEAMALGRPVVSTSIGCEGLDVAPEKHLLVADDPEDFADATARLILDCGLNQRIVSEARQLVVDHYNWDAIASDLMHFYAEMTNADSASQATGRPRG